MKKIEVEIKEGTVFEFTPTGKCFTVAAVTEKRVSWFVGFCFKGGKGINNLKKTWSSRKQFEDGIQEGIYKLKNGE